MQDVQDVDIVSRRQTGIIIGGTINQSIEHTRKIGVQDIAKTNEEIRIAPLNST